MVSKKELAGKSTLFTLGAGLIAKGVDLLETDLKMGLAACAIGLGMVVVFVYLLEKQVTEAVAIKLLRTR